QMLQKFILRGYPRAVECTVSQHMELRYWLDLGGFEHGLPAVDRIYQYSAVARVVERANALIADPAAIARTLLTLTSYGYRPSPTVPRAHVGGIRRALAIHLGLS